MIEDIESVHDMITSQAKEHIHSNDVILTYGRSNILDSFFQVKLLNLKLLGSL